MTTYIVIIPPTLFGREYADSLSGRTFESVEEVESEHILRLLDYMTLHQFEGYATDYDDDNKDFDKFVDIPYNFIASIFIGG